MIKGFSAVVTTVSTIFYKDMTFIITENPKIMIMMIIPDFEDNSIMHKRLKFYCK